MIPPSRVALVSLALMTCQRAAPSVPRAAPASTPAVPVPVPVRVAAPARPPCAADLTTSASDCGGCGHACAEGQRCLGGACRVERDDTMMVHHRPVNHPQSYVMHRRYTVTPAVVPLGAGVTSFTLGVDLLCAIHDGGRAACMGDDRYGALGDAQTERYSPTPVDVAGLADLAQIDAGQSYTCARRRDGTVACWGMNYTGATGQPAGVHPQVVPQTVPGFADAVALDAGTSTACVVRATGAVWCWGQRLGPERDRNSAHVRTAAEPVAGVHDALSVSVGGRHACALERSGRVACWGENNAGALGDGSDTARSDAREVPGMSDVRAVSCGWLHTCATRVDGSVWCWGLNYTGQVGATASARTGTAGAVNERLTPVLVAGINDATAVAAGGGHTCALRADGTVWCWGADHFGQLGDGASGVVREAPAPVRWLADVVAIDASTNEGDAVSCALTRDGVVRCWGNGASLWDLGRPTSP